MSVLYLKRASARCGRFISFTEAANNGMCRIAEGILIASSGDYVDAASLEPKVFLKLIAREVLHYFSALLNSSCRFFLFIYNLKIKRVKRAGF